MCTVQTIWEYSIEDIQKGYWLDVKEGQYVCLICGKTFVQGYVYPQEAVWMDAEMAVRTHIQQEHGSVFRCLLQLDKRYTGLTDLQRELLTHFYEGHGDQDIVDVMGIGSSSTVRNHRFILREKEKQARVFLAIMGLLDSHQAGMKMQRETAELKEKRLKLVPRKEAKMAVLLQQAACLFVAGKRYDRVETNQVLGSLCEDYVTLRRILVDRGILAREPDGNCYWLKNGDLQKDWEMDKKELKFKYKSTPRLMGVYQIKNKVNGKVLVESTLNLDGRRNRFSFEVSNGCVSKNRELLEDWQRYGAEAFSFEILELLKPVDDPVHDYRNELADLEKAWLEKLQPYGERGYNRLPIRSTFFEKKGTPTEQ